jgi:hypothetical protein
MSKLTAPYSSLTEHLSASSSAALQQKDILSSFRLRHAISPMSMHYAHSLNPLIVLIGYENATKTAITINSELQKVRFIIIIFKIKI